MDRPARIIVLDDEAELRNMLQRFLSGHGFEVRAVERLRKSMLGAAKTLALPAARAAA